MKILVVEDEKKVAGFIKRGLEEDQYEVTVTHDGADGLKQALEGDYSLIILDVMLPKKDGLTVIKELREAGKRTPVLMLTAKTTTEDIVSGLDAGSDDYLTKPFAFAELTARVRALIRREGHDRGAEIQFADLRLDPVSHKVWRGKTEIELTAKEYGLIEYLMRNPNTVLSRAMIADHVWDYAFDSFTNIIDVYVNYLRKKVDKDFPTKLIHTVRGQGYVMREG
ncbi:MAG: response regulator transcription factor [Verrucomicrobia bacterium]|nr:response regulator transcription factor [Deltaproteobacteria bacterium]